MRHSLAVYNIFKCQLPFSRQYLGKLEEEHDFVLLQEWVSSIAHKESSFLISNATFTLPLKRRETGTATISKHPPVAHTLAFSLGRELGFLTRKSLIISTHDVKGRRITLFNCHALNFVPTGVWKKTMKVWLARLPEKGPVILAGDFNTWAPARYAYLHDELQKKGFSYANYEDNIIMRLDHVWYRDVHNVSCSAHTGVHTSDHYPLIVEFSL